MNVEWSVPVTLTSPYGTIGFNQQDPTTGLYFVLDPSKCLAFRGLRQTVDPVPQASGSIVHREYTEGYSMRLAGWIMEGEDQPACGSALRAGWDALGLHLNALLAEFVDINSDTARIQWTPTDYAQDRLLGDVRLLEELTPTITEGLTEFSFAVHSPFPYAVDEIETTTTLRSAGVAVINSGNVPVFPNFKIFGDFDNFTIAHVESGKQVLYDASQPGGIAVGAGDWAFVGGFANTIYLNDDADNLKAGLNVEYTDFFPLLPGVNTLTLFGAERGVMLWNVGWA